MRGSQEFLVPHPGSARSEKEYGAFHAGEAAK
jgi:hypothetical protein